MPPYVSTKPPSMSRVSLETVNAAPSLPPATSAAFKVSAKFSVASIGLVAKRPEQFGKAMIFPAMVETYAILALLISILSIFGIGGLAI